MTSRKAAGKDTSRLSIPNYGRGAFYGLAGALFGAAFWAFYMAITDNYLMLMPVAGGFLASSCVKRGMGRVDGTGIALCLYSTVMIVFLGEYFYFAWVLFTRSGSLSLAPPFFRIIEYFRSYPKDLFFILLFTGLGLVVAVLNCRNHERKRRAKRPAAGKVPEETSGERT